ncbi:UBP1-associated protein 2A [Zea mays]|uniref:UBP1-associated protein 2A n=1 Tax=Zea mays TaxID=4577 RepID=A0A1D6DX09_MAIZE|nr:UBP1-associated protein 2A [Zea mays]
MQQVFKQQQLHIKEVELLLAFKGHLGFRLARQLPRQALQRQRLPQLPLLLVIRLGHLGRARCLVLRSEALVFRVDIDRTRYINSQHCFMNHLWYYCFISFHSLCILCDLLILFLQPSDYFPCILVWHLWSVVRSCGFAFGWLLSLYWCQNVAKGFLLLNFTTGFEPDAFVAVFEGGTFLKDHIVLLPNM